MPSAGCAMSFGGVAPASPEVATLGLARGGAMVGISAAAESRAAPWAARTYLFQPEDRADRRRGGERERRNPECPGPGTSSSRQTDRVWIAGRGNRQDYGSPGSARRRRAPFLSVGAKALDRQGRRRSFRAVAPAPCRASFAPAQSRPAGARQAGAGAWREPRRFDEPHQFGQHFLSVCLLAAGGAQPAPDLLKIIFWHSYPSHARLMRRLRRRKKGVREPRRTRRDHTIFEGPDRVETCLA